MLPKIPPYRNKKWTQAAKDQACVNCGRADGTVVAAHYTGLRQQLLGKGKSQKAHDFCTADLCSSCHSQFDQYQAGDKWQRMTYEQKIDVSEQFLYLCLKTIERRLVLQEVKL